MSEVAVIGVPDGRWSERPARRLVAQMTTAFRGAFVEGLEGFDSAMTNEPKDRHVAAAASPRGASYIATANLDDWEREALLWVHGAVALNNSTYFQGSRSTAQPIRFVPPDMAAGTTPPDRSSHCPK